MDWMHTLSQTGPSKIASTLQTLLDQITLNLVCLIVQLPIKTGGSAQIYKRLISLSCSVFLLGKCHLDIGHHGSRYPSRSKFNHIALPGPVLTLISPWLVQESDLPCFRPGTLLPAPALTQTCEQHPRRHKLKAEIPKHNQLEDPQNRIA